MIYYRMPICRHACPQSADSPSSWLLSCSKCVNYSGWLGRFVAKTLSVPTLPFVVVELLIPFETGIPMSVKPTKSCLVLPCFLRLLLIVLVLTSTRHVAGQQIGQAGRDSFPPAKTTAGNDQISSPVSFTDVLQRLRETEARLQKAEERLAQNEDRWQAEDVESFVRPSPQPALQLSGYAADNSIGCQQPASLSECAPTKRPCLQPYCDRCLTRLSWNKNGYRITPFGSLAGEAILTDSSTTARAFIRYLNPDTGLDQSQSTVTGQGSAFGLNIEAPKVGNFEARGLFYFKFYGGQPAANLPGLFYLLGFGELRNENWRFVFGQNLDLIGPLQPHTLNFTSGLAGGNIGLATTRGQLRAERFFHPREDVQWTIQAALTQQFLPEYIAVSDVNGTDNGWPNIESRVALGFGEDVIHPLIGPLKPIEFGVSGLIGETRVTRILVGQRVSTTWAVVADAKISTERWGIQGEYFAGEALGSYGGGIDQSANLANGFFNLFNRWLGRSLAQTGAMRDGSCGIRN